MPPFSIRTRGNWKPHLLFIKLMNHPTQNLQLHIYKTDGSRVTFTQNEADRVNRILDEFQPSWIFTREQITIAGGNSLTSFAVGQVVRIDLVSESPTHWKLPSEIVDAVELTETEFRALLQNPELGDRWDHARAQDASVVAFLEMEMDGQSPLFLALEIPREPPADRPEAILPVLATPALCFRMRTGGIAALNLRHLLGFTLFPTPQKTPPEAWPAYRTKGPQLTSPTRSSHEPAGGRPLPSSFQPD